MAITIFEACRKRKRTPNIFNVHNLATNTNFHGPFKENIRDFLEQYAECEDYTVGTNPIWCSLLVNDSNGVVFPLYVVEEHVKDSSHPLCDLCRCVGWSHHFVSKRSYHLIIPQDDKWNKPLKKESLKLQNHLLHGVIHCNGFGHLVCINGIEGKSKYLHGKELMNLWDHLCSILQTREISVDDVSKKGSMELRLLHGVTYGRSWFGKWGYKFCHGSFGVTQQKWSRAVEILSSLELDKIVHDFTNTKQSKSIQQIIQTYRDACETRLVTLRDLLRFMLAFKSKPPIQRKTALALSLIMSKSSKKATHQDTPDSQSSEHDSFASHQGGTSVHKKKPTDHRSLSSFVAKLDSRWPARRLEHAVKLIFNILEAHGATMNRQELRDAVREHIGDTGMIDFVLKNIGKVTIGNQVICRSSNPTNRLLEFSLQELPNGEKTAIKMESRTEVLSLEKTATEKDSHAEVRSLEKSASKKDSRTEVLSVKPGRNVYKDMLFLYKNVLLGYPDHHSLSISSRTILDTRHFVKGWKLKDNNDKLLRLTCRVRPKYDELMNQFTWPLPPGEVVVVPQSITVGELKLVVQCALRDTYCIMDKFVVRELELGELDGREEEDVLMCVPEQEAEVWVRGCGMDLSAKLRYQGGPDDWRVECGCGARDDDGERMVACDVCHVWQHTRCNGINDDDAAPSVFLCGRCRPGIRR